MALWSGNIQTMAEPKEERLRKARERMRALRAEDPERFRGHQRAFNERHKEKIAAKRKAAYAARSEEQKEYDRKKNLEAMHRWLKKPENREKHRKRAVRWNAENYERYRSNTIAWQEANPEKVLLQATETAHKRRAQKLEREFAPIDYFAIPLRTLGCCGVCGEPVGPNFHYDHIKPLSKGGSHTTENLQLAHPLCNIRKGAKLVA